MPFFDCRQQIASKKENTLGIRLYKFSFFRVRYMGRMKSMYGNGYGLDTYISNERKEYSA